MALQKPKREGRKKYYCGMMALTFIKGMDLAILHTTTLLMHFFTNYILDIQYIN